MLRLHATLDLFGLLISLQKMQQKYNGMSDVECVTNIDNIGMVWKIHLSTLKWDIKRSNLKIFYRKILRFEHLMSHFKVERCIFQSIPILSMLVTHSTSDIPLYFCCIFFETHCISTKKGCWWQTCKFIQFSAGIWETNCELSLAPIWHYFNWRF